MEKETVQQKQGRIKMLFDRMLPIDSGSRALVKLLYKTIQHPIQTCRQISPYRIRLFLSAVMPGSSERLSDVVNGYYLKQEIMAETMQLLPLRTDNEEYPEIVAKACETPLVSIIIPVFNQFAYTYNCIQSIVDTCTDVSYEIIVADDASTDRTKQIAEIISGIRVIRNEQNLRFLKNCNHAAEQAKGKYIVLLNNDTQVQKKWVQSLIGLTEKDDTIGMAGSKFVFPNGRLQEAGGILWRNGTAMNYGRGSVPDFSEFNYVKDVDYISGASIMIRASLWRQLGGFDERYAPAYCEDSDLALSVWNAGYRVVYQPQSIVVHFEGLSNGTDVNSGQKAYQAQNQQKLYAKWKDMLQSENGMPKQDLFRARSRALHKKTLLMIDAMVPEFDQDAGSRTVYQYLKLFVKEGYQVTLFGDNFYRNEPYTSILQQMGVEVLYGEQYALSWKRWIKNNGANIDYIWLNRPNISDKYIAFSRKYTKAKIIYYGHDLHFMRLMRQYELSQQRETLVESQRYKAMEVRLLREADMSYYPSCVEERVIRELDPGIPVRCIPPYLYSDTKEGTVETDFTKRKDLLFVGGFRHTPNVDAVQWFVQSILPKVLKRNADVRLHIVGSNVPQEILDTASENVIIEGRLSDPALAALYETCRVAVVPLRYGAGIKGKIVESLYYGLPVVTTSVGAEGLVDAETVLTVADDEAVLAESIATLYEDVDRLRELSRSGQAYVAEHFSPANAVRILSQDFDMKAKDCV